MATNTESWGNRALLALLGSPARARVLTWLVLHPEEPVFLRDLARQCGLSVTPVHRQLGKLEEIGLVQSEVVGNARRYRLSPRFPALGAVKDLIAATTGLVPRLRERLDRPGVECAFVFGSGATGEEQADSDVDLFVIGDIDGVLLANLVREVEREARKQVDLVHWSPADFSRQMVEPSSFLSAVMRQPKAFVKGDEDALRCLAGQ